jgi:hypothetical protein
VSAGVGMGMGMGKIATALVILWPAFFMAGVLEMLVFAVVDPDTLTGISGLPLGLPRQAIYTVCFFVFWGAVTAASAMSLWLSRREG